MFVVKAIAVHHAGRFGTFLAAASDSMTGTNMAAHASTKLKTPCGAGCGFQGFRV
jgi:hypothetical protein